MRKEHPDAQFYCSSCNRRKAHRRGWLRPAARCGGAQSGPSRPFLIPEAEQSSVWSRPMTKEMTGAEMVIEALADQGVEAPVRLSGRRGAADLRRAVPAGQGPAHPGAARAGRRARGRGLCALDRQGRLRAGDLGPGRDQRGHRPHRCADGFDPDRGHHRAGADPPDRQRRLPGMRHGRHHAAVHQAQLPGQEHRRPAARAARGVPHRRERTAGAGGGRHPEGHPVRQGRLFQAEGLRPQGLPAEAQGRPRQDQGRDRADAARQAAAVLHRRRRHQFRPRGQPAAARAGQAHRLSRSPRP